MEPGVEGQSRRRMNWIGLCLSLPALGAWIWILVQLMPGEVVGGLSVPITLLIGGAAYALHRFLWKWRGTVVVTALTLHVVALSALIFPQLSSNMSLAEGLWAFLEFPVDMIRWTLANLDPAHPSMAMGAIVLVSSLAFTLLHPLYPTFCTAMASSIGFSIYILVTFQMMSHAG